MKAKRAPIFYWALWTGLAIWVVSLAGIVLSPSAEHVGVITNAVASEGSPVAMLVMAIAIPIIEEVSFRFWAIRRWRWAGYVSATAMGYVVYLYWGLWGAVPVVLAVAAVTAFVRNENTRLLILMLFTSLLFAVLHFDNYGNLQLQNIFAITDKAGFGLVASWLVLNHGFLWAVLLHAATNALVVAAISLSLYASPTVGCSFTSPEGWSVFAHRTDLDVPLYTDNDSLYTGTMPDIATALLLQADSSVRTTYTVDSIQWEIIITNGSPSPMAIVHEMEQNDWIRLDTTSLSPMEIAVSAGENLYR